MRRRFEGGMRIGVDLDAEGDESAEMVESPRERLPKRGSSRSSESMSERGEAVPRESVCAMADWVMGLGVCLDGSSLPAWFGVEPREEGWVCL